MSEELVYKDFAYGLFIYNKENKFVFRLTHEWFQKFLKYPKRRRENTHQGLYRNLRICLHSWHESTTIEFRSRMREFLEVRYALQFRQKLFRKEEGILTLYFMPMRLASTTYRFDNEGFSANWIFACKKSSAMRSCAIFCCAAGFR